MHASLRAALALISLAGCGPSEERFLERYFTLSCERLFDCYGSEDFPDVDACVAAYEVYLDDATTYYADCAYSVEDAQECLRAYRSLECEPDLDAIDELNEACRDVWTCPT